MTLDELRGRLTVTVPEAGRLLGIGEKAAYAAAQRGEIPTLRLGRRLLVPIGPLLELVGLAGPDAREAPPASSASAEIPVPTKSQETQDDTAAA